MRFTIPKNCFEILNGYNNIEKLPNVEYKMVKQKYSDLCFNVKNSWQSTIQKTHLNDDLDEITETIRNPNYKEPNEKMYKFINKYFTNELKLKPEYSHYNYSDDLQAVFEKHFTLQDLLDYMGIIPFVPSVMINISPNWGDHKISKKDKIKLLTEVIEKYFSDGNRYDYYSYVIECGHSGDNIHAHAVGHINKDLLASVLDGKNSHIRKARYLWYIKKFSDQFKGIEGYPEGIKGLILNQSVQTSICRTEQMVSDKLDYLDEYKKPESHKNKHIILGDRLISPRHETIKSGRVDKIL